MLDFEQCVEITLKTPDDFLKVCETLSRMGVASRKDKTLYQSCHLLHKRGRYYILHFKQLIALDGKPTDISENDLARTATIALLLEEWGLLVIANPGILVDRAPLHEIKIIAHKEKVDWQLVAKYTIGKRKPAETLSR